MSEDTWTPHKDGFVKGRVAVFPGHFGSWEVWDNLSGEWRCSEPFTCAGRKAGDQERTREETIEEAKRLAEQWRRERGH